MKAIRSAPELYAHAIAIEREAAERYAEFAQLMADEGNEGAAAVFARLAALEAEHLEVLLRRTEDVALPAPPDGNYRWLDAGAPETAAHEFVYRLMTPHQALAIALGAEQRASAFFESVHRTADDPALRALAQDMAMEEKEHIAMVEHALELHHRAVPALAADLRQMMPAPGRAGGGPMYKHILIPTDGSETANKAVHAGVDFAREANAKVTCFTAMPEYQMPSETELMSRHAISPDEHARRCRKKAEAIFADVASRASAAGIEFETEYVQSDRPYEAIIDAAKRHGCDLIFMASHGRRGISALLHGSQTQDVLTHSTIPTLVYR